MYFREPFGNSRIQGVQKKLKKSKIQYSIDFSTKQEKCRIDDSKGNTQFIHSFLSELVKNSISKVVLTLYGFIRLQFILMQYNSITFYES